MPIPSDERTDQIHWIYTKKQMIEEKKTIVVTERKIGARINSYVKEGCQEMRSPIVS
jgi:hypothetical protein